MNGLNIFHILNLKIIKIQCTVGRALNILWLLNLIEKATLTEYIGKCSKQIRLKTMIKFQDINKNQKFKKGQLKKHSRNDLIIYIIIYNLYEFFKIFF